MQHVPAVAVGWVVAEPMPKIDRRAAEMARRKVLAILRQAFPNFLWTMPIVRRQKLARQRVMEPVTLLDAGGDERERGGWDFAIVITEADLKSYYRESTLGAPSQSLGVAVASTARLDPALTNPDVSSDSRVETLANRLAVLTLHLFGHLNDLEHAPAPTAYMHDVASVADLDSSRSFADASRDQLQRALEAVADVRLEESDRRTSAVKFFLKSLWHNRTEIVRAIGEIEPWKFPYYFNRLTTAAASTLVILLITAEAWDLGMSRPPEVVIGLSLVALVSASYYVIRRQHLFGGLRRGRLTERQVIARTSLTIAVAMGMTTTYLLLYASTLTVALTIFSPDLIQTWAASLHERLRPAHYFTLAGFVAALGIVVGALGASFEAKGYFRHVAYVDEET